MKLNITQKELSDLYLNQKLSSLKIAKIYGVSKRTILHYLEKYNIPRRTISEAMLGHSSIFKGKKRPDFSGKNNPNFGKRWSGSQKKHLSELRKRMFAEGKLKVSEKTILKAKQRFEQLWKNPEWRKKQIKIISEKRKGIKNGIFKLCETCKKEFYTYKSTKRKFCCLNCYLIWAKDKQNNPFYGKHHSEKMIQYFRERAKEQWKKYSDEKKEKFRTLLREKNSGTKNPFYGKRHSETAKNKMSETKKIMFKTGKIIPSKWMLGKHLSEEAKQKIRESHQKRFLEHPEQHPNYKISKRNKMRLSTEVPVYNLILKMGYALNKDFFFNYHIKTNKGNRYADFAFPLLKLDIECDGKRFHKNLEEDKYRDDELFEIGWKTLRLSEDEIKNKPKTEQKLFNLLQNTHKN